MPFSLDTDTNPMQVVADPMVLSSGAWKYNGYFAKGIDSREFDPNSICTEGERIQEIGNFFIWKTRNSRKPNGAIRQLCVLSDILVIGNRLNKTVFK